MEQEELFAAQDFAQSRKLEVVGATVSEIRGTVSIADWLLFISLSHVFSGSSKIVKLRPDWYYSTLTITGSIQITFSFSRFLPHFCLLKCPFLKWVDLGLPFLVLVSSA